MSRRIALLPAHNVQLTLLLLWRRYCFETLEMLLKIDCRKRKQKQKKHEKKKNPKTCFSKGNCEYRLFHICERQCIPAGVRTFAIMENVM